jgi:hypothetical protein
MNKAYLSLFIFAVTLCSGCRSKDDNIIARIIDAPTSLSKTKDIGGSKIKVSFRPVDDILAQEQRTRKNMSDSLKLTLKSQYNKYLYFVISMSRDNNEILSTARSEEERQQEMSDLVFHMDQYITARTSEGDTLPIADYVYPRTYGASRSTDLMIAFYKPSKKTNDVTITVQDIGIGAGINKFSFSTADIDKVQELNLP